MEYSLAVLVYKMLKQGVPKSYGTWEQIILVITISGMKDKVRPGMLFFTDNVLPE